MEQFKALFVGLAGAGKTSIILTLRRQFSDLSDLKPTKGIERSEIDILGFKILTWDLGGQDIYRAEYKKKEAVIFSETEILYYIVDMIYLTCVHILHTRRLPFSFYTDIFLRNPRWNHTRKSLFNSEISPLQLDYS